MSSTSTKPTPWIRTPLVESAALSEIAGCRVFLKLENLQPCGSFKSRGIGNLVQTASLAHSQSPSSSQPHFYSSSGGNAGLACVSSSTLLGHPSTVVVPLSTKPHMIDRIRLAGHGTAEVIQHGQTWFEADLHLRTVLLPNDPDGVYVPPFDHADIWTGASGMVDEIEEDLGGCADVVVCSVGGGGLFCGIMQGLEHSTGTKIIAVETKGADSLAQSVAAGELITLPGITSIATSLGATRVASQALKYAQEDRVKCWVVSDEQACGACVRFADGERMLVEPACGAALSVVYEDLLRDRALRLAKESRVVVVVCGGVGVGVEMIAEWRAAGLGSRR